MVKRTCSSQKKYTSKYQAVVDQLERYLSIREVLESEVFKVCSLHFYI
jgi:hypothetical protein